MFDLVSFIPRAVMQGIPLLFGSTGEILTEKSGNLNLGIPCLLYTSGDDLAGDGLQPVKTLLGHLLGQDGHGLAGQQLGVEGAAAAVGAGGGPHGVVIGSVELTGHQAGSQAAEGGADLVAAGGEPLAGHGLTVRNASW